MRAPTEPARRARRRGSSVVTVPAVAGVAYTAAWLTGLAVWPSNPTGAGISLGRSWGDR